MIPEYKAYREYLVAKDGVNLEINDWQAVDILMAATVAHKLAGEMLWLRVIGASGSGKTEILRSILEQKGYAETLEVLTPSAIRRGLQLVKGKKPKDDKGETEYHKIKTEPYLLELLDGKLVITKELAPLLTKQHESRLEIFGLLRSVHDGELVADYGSLQGRIKQKCRFDWIIGTTSYVDSENQLEMQLGSRFTDLRWGSPISRLDTIRKAIYNVKGIEVARAILVGLVKQVIDKSCYTDSHKAYNAEDWLANLANIVAHFRTPVPRDKFTRDVADQPSIESGTRPGQSFAKIAMGLRMLGIEDTRPHLTRLAWDAIPPNRCCVLKSVLELEHRGEKVTQEAIENCNHTGLSQSSISYIIKDIKLLKEDSLPWREHLGNYYTYLPYSIEAPQNSTPYLGSIPETCL